MSYPLKIGVWSEQVDWRNRVIWLFNDEFGFPTGSIDDLKNFPLLVLSYGKFIENFNRIMSYLGSLGNVIIVCTSNSREDEAFECDKLFVKFEKRAYLKGTCLPVESHVLSRFFPKRKVHPQKRRDFVLAARIRDTKILSPAAEVVVNFKTLVSSICHPLLICGKTDNNRRFAIITADEFFLDFKDSYWPALIYLAAAEWCLWDKPFIRKWHWPNNKRIMINLTFDFETLSLYRDGVKAKKFCWWNRRLDYFLLGAGIRRIMQFLKTTEIPSTWFLLGSQVFYTPSLTRRIFSNSLIELAGHGDFHEGIDKDGRRFDQQDKGMQMERLSKMKKMIHAVIKKDIDGFRAPGLYANVETLLALEKCGFRWDSSASPQTNYPLRWLFLPFCPVKDWIKLDESNIIEIPVLGPWERWCPAHGAFHTPNEYLNELLEDFAFLYRIGGLQTLLLHPYQIAVKIEWLNAVKTFISKVSELKGVSFATCGQIADYWIRRKKAKISAYYDSSEIHIRFSDVNPDLSFCVYRPEGLYIKSINLENCEQPYYENWDCFSIFAINREGEGECVVKFDCNQKN